jgi:hypothetical protein
VTSRTSGQRGNFTFTVDCAQSPTLAPTRLPTIMVPGSGAGGSGSIVMFAAIGGGAFFVLVIAAVVIVILMRRVR